MQSRVGSAFAQHFPEDVRCLNFGRVTVLTSHLAATEQQREPKYGTRATGRQDRACALPIQDDDDTFI